MTYDIGTRVTPKKWFCKDKYYKSLLGKVAVIIDIDESSRDGDYYVLEWEDKVSKCFDGRSLNELCSSAQADAFRQVK